MSEQLSYRTLSNPGNSLFKDRGSRFLGFAYPVKNLAEIKQHIQQLKNDHPKAVHYCYAYRLGTDKNNYRLADDGEPSGSAGRPILGQIDSAELTNILVIVVRYFGGTLLGVPGLIHAYKTAASLALDCVEIVELPITKSFQLDFDYPVLSVVLHQLEKVDAQIIEQDLTLFCRIKADIPLKKLAPFLQWGSSEHRIQLSEIKHG